jgi:hypothetical protein
LLGLREEYSRKPLGVFAIRLPFGVEGEAQSAEGRSPRFMQRGRA